MNSTGPALADLPNLLQELQTRLLQVDSALTGLQRKVIGMELKQSEFDRRLRAIESKSTRAGGEGGWADPLGPTTAVPVVPGLHNNCAPATSGSNDHVVWLQLRQNELNQRLEQCEPEYGVTPEQDPLLDGDDGWSSRDEGMEVPEAEVKVEIHDGQEIQILDQEPEFVLGGTVGRGRCTSNSTSLISPTRRVVPSGTPAAEASDSVAGSRSESDRQRIMPPIPKRSKSARGTRDPSTASTRRLSDSELRPGEQYVHFEDGVGTEAVAAKQMTDGRLRCLFCSTKARFKFPAHIRYHYNKAHLDQQQRGHSSSGS